MRTSIILLICGAVVGYVMYPTLNPARDISDKLSKVDNKHYEIFEEIRHANDIISNGISDGTIRLHVRTDSETTTGVANGQRARCNIHATDARRIIEITKRADECSSRLSGLQEWVLEHIK